MNLLHLFSNQCSGNTYIDIHLLEREQTKTDDSSKCNQPYLDTTTSKQVENTKAFELTIIKELGKMTP